MFDRPASGERVILVHLHFSRRDSEEILNEFQGLAMAAGATSLLLIQSVRQAPDPKYFIGLGKAEEIQQAVITHQAEVILFNHELSPAQERNLEQLFKCRVVGRTGLILDIFAQRARTFEGKLQVELAQLQHLSTRLIRGWTHLERQRGGIGLRGPGETQLESDRRLIRRRIKTIKKRLEKVHQQRFQTGQARRKARLPVIALVGYTNAGKSTLFNKLTRADVWVADQLFATLDPTLRRFWLPNQQEAILADTVGFIRALPLHLIEAFQATLEQTREADLLIHVLDAQNVDKALPIHEVQSVLKYIKADHIPQLMVYNKIDKVEQLSARVERNLFGLPSKIWVSASTGDGIDLLQQSLVELITAHVSSPSPALYA